MTRTIQTTLAALTAAAVMLLFGAARAVADFPAPPKDTPAMSNGVQTAVLPGGCFWGMEGVFERLKGVQDVVSGYSGGEKNTAAVRARELRDDGSRGVDPGPL